MLSFTCWELSRRRVWNPILPLGEPRLPGPLGPPQGFGDSANASLRREAFREAHNPTTPTTAIAAAVFRGNGRTPDMIVFAVNRKQKMKEGNDVWRNQYVWGHRTLFATTRTPLHLCHLWPIGYWGSYNWHYLSYLHALFGDRTM